MAANDVKIVIGSWGSYNECNERALGSEWICLNDYDDWEEIEAELVKQGFELNGIDEELFVQDAEFPASGVSWDYVHPKSFFEILKNSGVLDDETKYEKMEAYFEIESYDEWKRLVEQYDDDWDEEVYLYPGMDWYDLGYELMHETNEVPDWLEDYIDYRKYGETLSYDGFYEYGNGIIEIRR